MADFHDSREFAVTDVRAARAEQVQVGLGGVEGVARAGDRQGQPAGGGHPRVAHDRRGEQRGAPGGQPLADVRGDLG